MRWQGIPAQVKAEDSQGGKVSREMPEWFAQEIDRVAMRDGLAGTDAYLEEFAWTRPVERDGDAEDLLDAVITEEAAKLGRKPDGHPLEGMSRGRTGAVEAGGSEGG
jgi:hypothetical protein